MARGTEEAEDDDDVDEEVSEAFDEERECDDRELDTDATDVLDPSFSRPFPFPFPFTFFRSTGTAGTRCSDASHNRMIPRGALQAALGPGETSENKRKRRINSSFSSI